MGCVHLSAQMLTRSSDVCLLADMLPNTCNNQVCTLCCSKMCLKYAAYVQVLLRWALQYGVGAVCEAAGKDIDRANVGVFEWSLSEKDFKKLSNIKPS